MARRVGTVALAMCGVSTTLGTVSRSGVNAGLAFKHIQAGCGNALLTQRHGQRRVVHNAAARNVDERGRGLHQRQLGCTNGVVRCRAVGHHQHDVVCRAQQLFLPT